MPLYSQYIMNGFLLNPAMAGTNDYIPIRLTARQQWTGIKGAPSTQAISGHGLLKNNKMGLGGYLFSDRIGPVSTIGVQASYSYHLTINRDIKLSLGLSGYFTQHKLDEQDLVLIEESDARISGNSETAYVPDATFGVYMLSDDGYYAGISIANLFQYKIKLGDSDLGNNKVVRHYYLSAGYKFDMADDFELEPSVLVKTAITSPTQLDFNIKAFYMKNYWLGVSYRSKNAIVGMLGVKVDKYYIGYSFDYGFSNIKYYNSGSHEIMIGINIGEGANKGNSII